MLYFNGVPMVARQFPNRELYVETAQLTTLDRKESHTIGLRFEGNDDLMALLLLKGQMDDLGFERVTLFIPYFPYSTMDHTDGSRPLSLKYVARLVNAMGFARVVVWEAHSPVLATLLDRVELRETTVALAKRILNALPTEKLILCFPDAGAAKRYAGSFAGLRTATFQKQRDFATGNILGMTCLDALNDIDAQTTAVLVDDLCRAGRTFLECGKCLRAAGVGTILLCVTHLENGIFTGPLLNSDGVDRIYATDSCLTQADTHERLTLVSAFNKTGEWI